MVAVGRLTVGTPVETRGTVTAHEDLDQAIGTALGRPGHWLVRNDFSVTAFGPKDDVFAPRVADFTGTGVSALVLNGGERVYLQADKRCWVDVPGLPAFHALPAADQETTRNRWADLLATAAGLSKAEARALPVAVTRLELARHAATAFPVKTVHRGDPAVDAGGVVNGVSLPALRLPLTEPDVYLPVIAQVEGRLESINAWDLLAGVSLGPIQFNCDRAAVFRFFWQLHEEDPALFASELTKRLDWTMTWHDDHPDLVAGSVTLHGRPADHTRNARYLQTGKPDGEGRDGPFRRKLAVALRNCVAWPHVQDMVSDVSAWYLAQALGDIRKHGIGPLDPVTPDHDTFVLTAMLVSARVRYSSCLGRFLTELDQYPTTASKLADWKTALAATADPCPTLKPRLTSQQKHAEAVFQQIERLLKA